MCRQRERQSPAVRSTVVRGKQLRAPTCTSGASVSLKGSVLSNRESWWPRIDHFCEDILASWKLIRKASVLPRSYVTRQLNVALEIRSNERNSHFMRKDSCQTMGVHPSAPIARLLRKHVAGDSDLPFAEGRQLAIADSDLVVPL